MPSLAQIPAVPAINANIIIIIALLLGGVYGLIAGKQRLRILILSVYVGIVLADQFTDALAPSLHMLGHDQVSWLLLGLPIIIFGFFGVSPASHAPKGAAVANIIVGILTGALIIASGLHLLPTSELSAVDSDSFLAMNLQQFYPYILGFLPVVALVLGFMRTEKKH